MKFLLTLGFISCAVIILLSGLKLQQLSAGFIIEKKNIKIKIIILSIMVIMLYFVQYSLLTLTLPITVMLWIIIGVIASNLLYSFIGALAGFTLKAKQEKINTLYVVRGMEMGINQGIARWLGLGSLFAYMASWIAALAIFWTHPLRDPSIYAREAMIIFIIPQLMGLVLQFIIIIPAVTSEDIDDDLRNAYLTQNFSGLIYIILFFLFPLGLFYDQYAAVISWLPPYWIAIITIPILYVLMAVIPFFMGLNKYKNQNADFLDWRLDWLKEMQNILLFADPVKKTEAFNNKIDELNAEINYLAEQDKYLKMYTSLDNLQPFVVGLPEKDKMIYTFVINNKNKLSKWDVRIAQVNKLQEYHDNIDLNNINASEDYIKNNIAFAENEMKESSTNGKNKIAPVLISAITAILGFFFKTYQSDILNVLNNFKRL